MNFSWQIGPERVTSDDTYGFYISHSSLGLKEPHNPRSCPSPLLPLAPEFLEFLTAINAIATMAKPCNQTTSQSLQAIQSYAINPPSPLPFNQSVTCNVMDQPLCSDVCCGSFSLRFILKCRSKCADMSSGRTRIPHVEHGVLLAANSRRIMYSVGLHRYLPPPPWRLVQEVLALMILKRLNYAITTPPPLPPYSRP
jgi:hypothetical protein